MNTGIGDAYDLSWKLSAALLGFGGPALLPSYELERRPVGFRNREGSKNHNEIRVAIGALYGPAMDEDSDAGEEARRKASVEIARLGNAENESLGIELGYHYAGSPIVAAEPGAEFRRTRSVTSPTRCPVPASPVCFWPMGAPCMTGWGSGSP